MCIDSRFANLAGFIIAIPHVHVIFLYVTPTRAVLALLGDHTIHIQDYIIMMVPPTSRNLAFPKNPSQPGCLPINLLQ